MCVAVEWDDATARRLQTKSHQSRSTAAQVRSAGQRHDNRECTARLLLRSNGWLNFTIT